jgi:hypothetical protein
MRDHVGLSWILIGGLALGCSLSSEGEANDVNANGSAEAPVASMQDTVSVSPTSSHADGSPSAPPPIELVTESTASPEPPALPRDGGVSATDAPLDGGAATGGTHSRDAASTDAASTDAEPVPSPEPPPGGQGVQCGVCFCSQNISCPEDPFTTPACYC